MEAFVSYGGSKRMNVIIVFIIFKLESKRTGKV